MLGLSYSIATWQISTITEAFQVAYDRGKL